MNGYFFVPDVSAHHWAAYLCTLGRIVSSVYLGHTCCACFLATAMHDTYANDMATKRSTVAVYNHEMECTNKLCSNFKPSTAPAAGVKPVAARAPPKPRLMSGRKPAGKTGGLGVKKMSKQVDQSLFDQAPEEQAPTPATVSLNLQ